MGGQYSSEPSINGLDNRLTVPERSFQSAKNTITENSHFPPEEINCRGDVSELLCAPWEMQSLGVQFGHT